MSEGSFPRKQVLFVTGTDTGVGKTFVCGGVLRCLRKKGINAGYQKWVSTGGGEPPEDLRECLGAAGLPYEPADLEWLVPYRFRRAASPHLAAELEGRQIEPAVILDRCRQWASRHELLVIEGVGGVLVPLRRDLLLADLLAGSGFPTLLVAKSGLGTLNHTLLSIEALRRRDIPILGAVFSDAAEQEDEEVVEDNLRTIAEVSGVRVFGRLRRSGGGEAEAVWKGIAEAVIGG